MTLDATEVLALTALAIVGGITGVLTAIGLYYLWARRRNKKP